MSNVLVLCIPSHGHVNPVLGLAGELIDKGEKVTFFCSAEFKSAVEETGADFKCYKEDLNIFQSGKQKKGSPGFLAAILEPDKFIDDILLQVSDLKFDYIVFSSAYPYASLIARVLNLPAVSSFAVFATLKDLFTRKTGSALLNFINDKTFSLKIYMMSLLYKSSFNKVRRYLAAKHHVTIQGGILNQVFNKGDLNIVYTSKYFIPDIHQYDDSFIFIGPPIYNKKYEVSFPFEKLKGKKVIYISMGTVFSNYSEELNNLFFKSFANVDAVVVMAAYKVDLSKFDIPANFIVQHYVPQSEILKHASVAITHAGMNSIGDLLYNNVPFVAIPLGADQFYLANRAQELGATIVLDIKHLTPALLTNAVEKVLVDPVYAENISKISDSFIKAGGYKKAVEEIFKLKKSKLM